MTRRDRTAINAINPSDGKLFYVYVTDAKLTWVGRRGIGAVYELSESVREVLGSPRAVFKGVREEGEKDWLCYCAIPTRAYDLRTGDPRPPWPGQVLLVFVNDDSVVYNWRWEPSDPSKKHLPMDYESRFDQKVL